MTQMQMDKPKLYTPEGGIVLHNDNFVPGGIPYANNVANILRSQLNRVKRTGPSFAELYGLNAGYLEGVMKGENPMTPEIVQAVERHSPLSAQELIAPGYRNRVPLIDDSKDGVVIVTAQQRASTERTTQRGPEGRNFYKYGDPSMQRYSPIIPEWIQELYVHDGVNPDTPDWAFNKGHRERQTTIFIGDVNFHWIDKEGNKYVVQTNTGDANYIPPFVPHTFTTRDGNGLILAITGLGAIGTQGFQQKIQGMTLQEYQNIVQAELPMLAEELATDKLNGIMFRRYADTSTSDAGAYTMRTLMDGIPYQPNSRAVEINVKQGGNPESLDIDTPTDKWGYNTGNVPVVLYWESHQQELGPGDSFSIQTNVPFAVRNTNGLEGKLVMMEVNPEKEDPMDLIALINRHAGQKGVDRVHSEVMQWF
ncbi:MAG: hypothetical protein IH934_06080 [Nanoarchaeota archaeon]|nr:hypothetical protein [Nanoarchaeota archaeon]